MQNSPSAALFLAPWLLTLSACSLPPKPPSVDESQRRPVNSAAAVELQVCKSDLQNTRILAHEASRIAEVASANAASANAARLAAQQALVTRAPAVESRNTVYTITFAFGSTRLNLGLLEATQLVEEAKSSPLVVLRGRTDGASDTPGEGRIARERSAAIHDYLVQAGVDPARIRATWQPAGDHAADNTSASGRALNRRVEIEVYRAAPQLLAIGARSAQ